MLDEFIEKNYKEAWNEASENLKWTGKIFLGNSFIKKETKHLSGLTYT